MNRPIPSGTRIGRSIAFIAGWIQDAWLIAGISFALILGVEMGWRVSERLDASRESSIVRTDQIETDHPYASEAWFPSWRESRLHHVRGRHSIYNPYLGWSVSPGRSKGLYVESSGYRHTIRPSDIPPRIRRHRPVEMSFSSVGQPCEDSPIAIMRRSRPRSPNS